MMSTDWAILIGITAIFFFLGTITRRFFLFICCYMMLLSGGIYFFILAELIGEVPDVVSILLFLGIGPYIFLIMRFYSRLILAHYSRKRGRSTSQESATLAFERTREPRTSVTVEISDSSNRIFYDGYLRFPGDMFFDGKGFLRSPGEMFYDGKGYLRFPGDMFFDGKGFLRSPGEMFYDGEGYLR